MEEISTKKDSALKSNGTLPEKPKTQRGLRFIEEFERIYSNVLCCKNSKKIKIKWVR